MKNNPVSVYVVVLRLRANLHITGLPRYMQEIGTPKIGSHIMNLHIKRPRLTVN